MASLVVIGERFSPNLESALGLIGKHFHLERVKDVSAGAKLAKTLAPVLLVAEDDKLLMDLLAQANSMMAKNEARVVAVVSRAMDPAFSQTLTGMGVTEIFLGINATTIDNKLRKHLRELDSKLKKNVTLDLGNLSEPLVFKAEVKKKKANLLEPDESEVVKVFKAIDAERYQVVPALDIVEDIWLIQELPKFAYRKWQVRLQGPNPEMGKFHKIAPTEYAWSTSGRPQAEKGFWVFRGLEPYFESGTWVFEGIGISLEFRKNNEVEGAKITAQDHILFVADDSVHAKKNIEKFKNLEKVHEVFVESPGSNSSNNPPNTDTSDELQQTSVKKEVASNGSQPIGKEIPAPSPSLQSFSKVPALDNDLFLENLMNPNEPDFAEASIEGITGTAFWHQDFVDEKRTGPQIKKRQAAQIKTMTLTPLKRYSLMLRLAQIEDLLSFERVSLMNLSPLWDFIKSIIHFDSIGLFTANGEIVSSGGPAVKLPTVLRARIQTGNLYVQPFFYRGSYMGGAYLSAKDVHPAVAFYVLTSFKSLLVDRDQGETLVTSHRKKSWFQRFLAFVRRTK